MRRPQVLLAATAAAGAVVPPVVVVPLTPGVGPVAAVGDEAAAVGLLVHIPAHEEGRALAELWLRGRRAPQFISSFMTTSRN